MDKKEINDILDSIKTNIVNRTTDSGFNIFEAFGVEKKEVFICRLMRALLNPTGAHGLKTEPLRLFYQCVFDKSDTPDFSHSSVSIEDEIRVSEDSHPRRVDIVIRIDEDVFPIEVKIGAGDQEKQLYDYYNHYFNNSRSHYIYYLTPAGRTPSQRSLNGLPIERVKLISFKSHILRWLEEMDKKVNNQPFLKEIISQFKGVIKSMSEYEDLKDIIGINDFDEKKIGAAIELLRNADSLMKEIRTSYLEKYIKCGDGFIVCRLDEKKPTDSHALLEIQNNKNESIAWICVDTNLYIYSKQKPKKDDGWTGKDNYWWTYIPVGSAKRYDMKHSPQIHVEIDIRDLLIEAFGESASETNDEN